MTEGDTVGQDLDWEKYERALRVTHEKQAMKKRKRSQWVEMRFRAKEPLRASLEAAAKRNGRSMSGEICRRLELISVILAALDTEVDVE